MKITSSAFSHGENIPSKFTCEGENINPPLQFTDIPPNAQALVLIMDDPDVPEFVRKEKMWDHWVVFNIPPSTTHVPENSKAPGTSGKNTSGHLAYEGPCPPDRQHRYFFKLYALDKKLTLDAGATKNQVEEAMKGHIIAKAELMGLYEKLRID